MATPVPSKKSSSTARIRQQVCIRLYLLMQFMLSNEHLTQWTLFSMKLTCCADLRATPICELHRCCHSTELP
jgi:hypothetical protein